MSSQERSKHVLLLLLLLILMHSLLWLLMGSRHHPHTRISYLSDSSSIMLHSIGRRSEILLLLGKTLACIELRNVCSISTTRQQVHEEIVWALTYLQPTLLNRV